MMRVRIVEIARGWIGTPFHHQQCVKSHGVDCIQLVAGVGHEAGVCSLIPQEKSNYQRRPNPRTLIAGMRDYLTEIQESESQPGDIALIEWREGLPMHLAILSGNGKMIHASELMGGVFEVPIDGRVTIHSFWRFSNG